MVVLQNYYDRFSCIGDECQSTCMDEKTFPRIEGSCGSVKTLALDLSCEEVLRLVWKEEDPVCLVCKCEPGESVPAKEELPAALTCMMWGSEYLQDTSVPFCVSLGTFVYMLEYKNVFAEDSRKLLKILEHTPDVQEQIDEIRRTFDQTQLYQTAENVILYVVQAFSVLIKESNLSFMAEELWDQTAFGHTDDEHRMYVRQCLERRENSPEHMGFMRRLAVAWLHGRTGKLANEDEASYWLGDAFLNYMILAAILPLGGSEAVGERSYFSKLAKIGRVFEHSSLVHEYMQPVLCDVFHLDQMSYILTFIVLFGRDEGRD